MNDVDDVLRRTYAEPDASSAIRPPSGRLQAALRAGRRRRARRQAVVGVAAATLTVGLLGGAVLLRVDRGDEVIPADTTTGVTVGTSATTAVGAPALTSPPTTMATVTAGGGPAAAAPGMAQFVAVSTSGRVEVWARTGLVRAVDGCRGAAACRVAGAAVADGRLWFVRQEGVSPASQVVVSNLADDAGAQVAATAAAGESWTLVGVSPDGRDIVMTSVLGIDEVGPLVVVRDGVRRSIGTRVTSAAISGDGRLAYAEAGQQEIVVRSLDAGAEDRIDLAAAARRGGSSMPTEGWVTELQWSPDRRRLLVLVNPVEGAVWGSLALGDEPSIVRLADRESVPACWTAADAVAVGAWTVSYEQDRPGPIAIVDAGTGRTLSTRGGQRSEIDAMACRGDGAVALVQFAGSDRSGGGDLVVVNAGGDATRLGTGYATVLPLGSGPVVLLDPATLPSPTTTTAPRLTAEAADAFAALTADGKLEVWLPSGKVRTIDVGTRTCGDIATCGLAEKVHAVALTTLSVWYGGADGTLWRAALDGSTSPEIVTTGVGAIEQIAVSTDDTVVWYVRGASDSSSGRSGATLVRRERGVETAVADDVVSVASSPDGTRLAYTTYSFTGAGGGPIEGSVIGELVVRDLATGTERRQPWSVRQGFPGALVDLRWSPDGTRFLVAASWEGQRDFLVPADLSTSLDAPAYLGTGGLEARSCWIDVATVARGAWSIVYAEGPSQPADVVAVDVRTGSQTPYGVGVYADTLACRSDGSVALVDKGTAYEQPGELVVVRPGGRRTVLGRGYVELYPG